MRKEIICTLSDFHDGTHGAVEQLTSAFRGDLVECPLVLSQSGGRWFKGRNGEINPVQFLHSEVFLRLHKASAEAQAMFLTGAYRYLSNEKMERILIEVEWTSVGKKRLILGTLKDKCFSFDLA